MAFQKKGYTFTGGGGDVLHVLPEYPAAAAAWLEISHEDIYGGGLSGTVLSKQPHDVPGGNLEAQVFIDFPVPVIMGKVFTNNYWFFHRVHI